jgi:hypothetical protein
VAAQIPRRPEVPGAPGVALPRPHLVGGAPESIRDSVRDSVREEMSWAPRDDEEPTNPYPRDPRNGAPSGHFASKTLSDPHPESSEAAQLASIIAAWENADPDARALMAEFSKRLGPRGK